MNTFASGNVRLRTRVVAQLCLGAALLIVWELAAVFFVDPFWIGEPGAIAVRLWNVFVEGDMLTHTGVTLGHAVAGLLASLIVGVPVGILFAANRFVAATLEPYFLAFYSLPRVALAPLLILWFGIGSLSKIMMAFSMVVVVVILNT
jgi:NitT/TauT family transport system permease protein